MNSAIRHNAHRAAGLMPGHSRMPVGFAANDDSPTALHKLTGVKGAGGIKK